MNLATDNDEQTTVQPVGGEWISSVANLSIQYNIGVIAPALLLLDPSRVSSAANTGDSLFPRSDATDSMLKSAVFGGAILGQCTMGLLGDLIGLEVAMIVTNALALIGTVGCSVAPIIGHNSGSVYTSLTVFRFVLGVGVGGKYPLGSAMRARASEQHDHDHQHRAKDVARGFFWQTPGAILPFVVSAILLWLFGEPNETHWRYTILQYVLLVGLGAVPSIAVLVSMVKQLKQQHIQAPNDEIDNIDAEQLTGTRPYSGLFRWFPFSRRGGYRTIRHYGNNNPVFVAIQSRSSWTKLAGTGLCWALYDFVYYGTSFNLPEIFARVLGGGGESLLSESWHNSLIALMGIPGVLLAIVMMEPMGGPKVLQWWGFVMIGFTSFLVALSYEEATDSTGSGNSATFRTWVALGACSLLVFSLNWGCNVSTYVLPIEVFPKSVASTFHGWSAGMGKCGAALGGYFFTKLNAVSVALTFTVCIACCVVGVVVTHLWIPDIPPPTTSAGSPTTTPVLSTKDSNISVDDDEAELTRLSPTDTNMI